MENSDPFKFQRTSRPFGVQYLPVYEPFIRSPTLTQRMSPRQNV